MRKSGKFLANLKWAASKGRSCAVQIEEKERGAQKLKRAALKTQSYHQSGKYFRFLRIDLHIVKTTISRRLT
jgi:hypothetical protein